MNLLLLNAASGSKLEQALEKLVDFGMDAGKDIFVAILIYSVGRFIIKQISVLIAKVLEKRKIETSVQTFLKSLVKILLNMVLAVMDEVNDGYASNAVAEKSSIPL